MAMMDAGVPITSPIAGVAMGLLLDEVSNNSYITANHMST
jgi:polyribonucleotide nucleotidyltransferase